MREKIFNECPAKNKVGVGFILKKNEMKKC